MTSSELL